MRVIELQGDRSSGKTSTMLLLYTILLQNGFRRVDKEMLPSRFPDFDAVLERDGKKYGFMTFGDILKSQRKYLSHFERIGCVAVICASRPFRNWRIQDHYSGGSVIRKTRLPDGSSNLEILEANLNSALAMYAQI